MTTKDHYEHMKIFSSANSDFQVRWQDGIKQTGEISRVNWALVVDLFACWKAISGRFPLCGLEDDSIMPYMVSLEGKKWLELRGPWEDFSGIEGFYSLRLFYWAAAFDLTLQTFFFFRYFLGYSLDVSLVLYISGVLGLRLCSFQ